MGGMTEACDSLCRRTDFVFFTPSQRLVLGWLDESCPMLGGSAIVKTWSKIEGVEWKLWSGWVCWRGRATDIRELGVGRLVLW